MESTNEVRSILSKELTDQSIIYVKARRLCQDTDLNAKEISRAIVLLQQEENDLEITKWACSNGSTTWQIKT